MNYCDYDAIVHYPPGAFGAQYKTDLTGKLEEVSLDMKLNADDVNSFRDKKYKTYRVLEPIILYRLFGLYQSKEELDKNGRPKGAWLTGRYLSTEFAESMIDAKIRLALNPCWFNTKMYEAKVLVPSDVIVNLGIVASVKLPSGTILEGGAEQLLLPYAWDESWVQGYRRVTARQLQHPPQYWPDLQVGVTKTKQNLYSDICPLCGYIETVVLPIEERFEIIGIKGNHYTMKRKCLNPQCMYYW